MGCGQSSSVKRLHTTPAGNRSDKLEESKNHGDHWNNSKPPSRKQNVPDDWNIPSKTPEKTSAKAVTISPKKDEMSPKQVDLKKEQQQIKLQRQKTEKLVNKLAQSNPEALGQASKEIINRIDHTQLKKTKQVEKISPDLIKNKQSVLDSIEFSNHVRQQSDMSSNVNKSIKRTDTKDEEDKKPKYNFNLPGAAVITRNVISYDEKPKGKTSRNSKRKGSLPDSDEGNTTNVVAGGAAMVVKAGNAVKFSHNQDTTWDTNRQPVQNTNVVTTNIVSGQNTSRKDDLNNLLEELDNENEPKYGDPPQEQGIRMINMENQDNFEDDESPVVHGQKMQEQPQKFNMEDANDHFDQPKDDVVKFANHEEPEPVNMFNMNDFNDEKPQQSPQVSKPKPPANQEKGFALDDLIDDFDQSKGNEEIQVKADKVHQNETQKGEDDFLAEFEW